MKPLDLIAKYYKKNSIAYRILTAHSELVAKKALKTAKKSGLNLDMDFIYEAALLHDIGIIFTNAPDIGCNGDKPYICHGYLGRQLLEKEGLPVHALVCERHTGTGLTAEEIEEKNLPLPKRDMLPVSMEEQIICYADKFFSKDPKKLFKEKSPAKVEKMMEKFGNFHVSRFKEWHKAFNS